MIKLLAIGMFILVCSLMSATAFPQAQYLIDGVNPLALTLDTVPPANCLTVAITLDPGGIINTPLVSGGCWIIWDTSQVAIVNVDAIEYPDGPWDVGATVLIPEAGGPGTYFVSLDLFGTVPIDQGPIPICDVEFCCQGPGQSQIIISTIPSFDTFVGDTTVWDPQIANGIIDLMQFAPPCECDINGPYSVYTNAFTAVTAPYTASGNDKCTNMPVYLYTTTCGDMTGATIDQDTGILTVPPNIDEVYCEVCAMDTANTDINTGGPVECCMDIEIEPGCCPPPDFDEDGIPDSIDNCPNDYNPNQEDEYPLPIGNGIPDACDCEGNFNCDEDCDGSDAAFFKNDFGRSAFQNPCDTSNPCNGDFDCDGDCDGTDAAGFKFDFGRSSFNNSCPACEVGDWCNY